jgi:hypothetical protein
MTMVYEHSRQFGAMGYENMYPHQHQQTAWKDPFHNANAAYPPMKQETSRPMNISMPYSQMPTSAPLATGSNYSTAGFVDSGELSIPQDISRSTYPSQQQYSTASAQNSAYATAGAYQSMDYAHSLQQQQAQQQQRKLSDQCVYSPRSHVIVFNTKLVALNTDQQTPALANSMLPEACLLSATRTSKI